MSPLVCFFFVVVGFLLCWGIQLGLLEVEDLTGTERPDERSVMTYISEFFHRFASQDIRENAARRVNKFMRFMRSMEDRENQYESRARELIDWTKQQVLSLCRCAIFTPFPQPFAVCSLALSVLSGR